MTARPRGSDLPETLSRVRLVEWLARRVELREPGAIVRFGDGERSALEAMSDDADSIAAATRRIEEESGLSLSPEAVLDVGHGVARAFDEADVLGVLFGRFDSERLNWHTSRYLEGLASGRRPALLAGTQLHQAIVERLPDLLAGRRVSAISCRDVGPVLEGEWDLEDVAVYQVPSQHSAREVDGPYEVAMHDVPIWPDAHDRVLAELKVREPGEAFLVGAGVFGKDLCIEIREKGGLALDLGSALDRIVGKITRGPMRRVRLLHAQGMPVTEIVAHLEERYGVEVDSEKVERLAEDEDPHWFGNPHDLGQLLRLLPGFHVLRPEPREEILGDRDGAPRIVHRGAGGRPEIALTFDDGPSQWTEEIAAVFAQHRCQATFFLCGAAVEERPEIVTALAAAGHELGNHLWSHSNASSQSEDELRAEIERTTDAIETAGAPRPTLIRPPYFSAPRAVAKAAAATGATAVILRSIGTSDWEARSPRQIVLPVLSNIEPGDIVCLHDGVSPDKRDTDNRRPTVDAVKRLVPALLARGLRPVTVSELLG